MDAWQKANPIGMSTEDLTASSGEKPVKIKCLIHEAEEGGFWAEVPSLPGCFTEGESREETLSNLREAIACYLDAPSLETP
jgi:predicted RNase H-like HicB family nuclease